MKRLIALLLLAASIGTAWGAPNSKSSLLLAKVYANTRYFYPAKNIAHAHWEHLLLNSLNAIDSLTEKEALLDSIEKHFGTAGIHIRLHAQKPKLSLVSFSTVKGRYWSYHGFGDSKNILIAGPIITPIYNLFLNPYGKDLKKITPQYLEGIQNQNRIAYTDSSLLVDIDGTWLEIPFNPKKVKTKKIPAYQTPPNPALATKIGVMQYWAALNLFYPYPIQTSWDSILTEAFGRIEKGATAKDALRYVAACIGDAHARISSRIYPRSISVNAIGQHLYVISYNPAVFDSSIIGARLISINGHDADSLLQETMALMPSTNEGTKKNLASVALMHERKDSILTAIIEYADKKRDTLQLPVVGFYKVADNRPKPAEALAGTTGIEYFDLSRTSSKKIIKALKSNDCNALILDMRYRAATGLKYLKHLTDTDLKDMVAVIPIWEYPERINEVLEPLEETKPIKSANGTKPDKIVVFLAGPMTVSYSETMLNYVKHHGLGTIIGSHTAGTTGNMVALRAWTGSGAGKVSFTGMIAMDYDGSIFYGIEPDIEVLPTAEGLINGQDEVLLRAVEYIRGQL